MKPTDLMIGDWMLINNIPNKIQAIDSIDAEIQADDELYYVGEDRYHSEDKVEGLPLTTEILEKNGWMQNGMTQEAIMECDGENYDDTWCEMTYDGELNCYFDCVGDVVLFTCDRGCDFLKIHFVHELQHALRLCGLNELADNFKI